jgi:hypothetical protein
MDVTAPTKAVARRKPRAPGATHCRGDLYLSNSARFGKRSEIVSNSFEHFKILNDVDDWQNLSIRQNPSTAALAPHV